jgi:hypothetical protein
MMADLFDNDNETAIVESDQQRGNEIAAREPSATVDWTRVIELAMTKEGEHAVEVLERLLALQQQEQARIAKEQFEAHWAAMLAEYPIARKGKKVMDRSGAVLYSYAPIEDIVRVYKPIIVKHGFAWDWEESDHEGNAAVTCIVKGYGHEKRTTVEVPVSAPVNKADDPMKMRGKASSYGRRYSFTGAFAIVLQNEDAESVDTFMPVNDALAIAPYYGRMLAAETKQELAAVGKEITEEIRNEDGPDSYRALLVRQAYRVLKESWTDKQEEVDDAADRR